MKLPATTPLVLPVVEFFSATDTGRARSNNEDAVALEESAALAVLADGMGGYNAGEVASGMATTPTGRSSTPPTRTRSTPAWARRSSSRCFATTGC